jgi:hypothetical protein
MTDAETFRATGDYREYLGSVEWQKRRAARLRIDDFRCARCKATRRLEVHHLNYDRIGAEDIHSDLVTMCFGCHARLETDRSYGENQNCFPVDGMADVTDDDNRSAILAAVGRQRRGTADERWSVWAPCCHRVALKIVLQVYENDDLHFCVWCAGCGRKHTACLAHRMFSSAREWPRIAYSDTRKRFVSVHWAHTGSIDEPPF